MKRKENGKRLNRGRKNEERKEKKKAKYKYDKDRKMNEGRH